MAKIGRLSALAFLIGLGTVARGNAEDRVVRFWHPYAQPQRTAERKQAATGFEQADPGVKAQIAVVPWANMHQRWRAAQAAAIRELDDVSLALGGDERFIPGILDRPARFEGRALAVPR